VSDNTDEMWSGPDTADELLPQLIRADGAALAVCSDGHVHVILDGFHVPLSPDDAEDWVAALYDAAQAAKEESNT